MRLYLSSYRTGDRFGELIAALGPKGRVAVVSNAVDNIPPESRLADARQGFDPVATFRAHGLSAFDLDLRRYFGDNSQLPAVLDRVDMVWATGGNAFLLRRALRQSGLDGLLRQRLDEGRLIYGGWSAGAVVAGPGLRGIDLMDDPWVCAPHYEPAPVWDGLGLVDFVVVPHFQSSHPEAVAASAAVAYLQRNGISCRPLQDGQVIIL
jgi:dipeptidase E